MHILIIEDDLKLGEALVKALQANGLDYEWLRRIEGAAGKLNDRRYDGVLLELNLHDGSGLDLLTHWRSVGIKLPVIAMTAQSALEARLAGLASGADDCMVMPFEMAEVIARLHAVLRRCTNKANRVWRFGSLVIEPQASRVTKEGELLELSQREFQLLVELASKPKVIIAKSVLARQLKPQGEPIDSATIDVHISNLRRKIGAQWIKTVRGTGYLFAA